MKKLLLLALTIFTSQLKAQCTVTAIGPSSICMGTCATLTAGGATSYTWMPGNFAGNPYNDCPSSTTTYTVIGQSGGCMDTAIVTVFVTPNPTVTASASQNPVCSGSTFTVTAYGAITYTWAPGVGLSCTSCSQATGALTSSMMYTVCGADMNGCISCTTIGAQVLPAPSVTFTMNPNFLPQVWDVTATYNGGGNPFTYDWDWGDGSAHDNTAYPSHTYTVAGWYNICCTLTDVVNGCSNQYCQNDSLYKASSAMITVNVINGSTAVTQHKTEKIIFYPNPANTEFIVETPGQSTVQVFDLSGKKVLAQPATGKTLIDISSLTEGIYLITIKTSERTLTKKLAVVR